MVWKMDSKNIHLANFLIDINSQIVASKRQITSFRILL